jgi:phenylalanyl-tRNA synthetase beta chain
MRVPLGWLAEWVDLPSSQEELEHRLTLAGLEMEEVEGTGPDLSQIRVGHVLECGQHPNADRLSFCRVDIGEEEPFEVVCGAANVASGQRIAFAKVGTLLPDGTKLKKSKIRGVTSHGMICSERELGLGEDHEGILVLDPEAPVGTPLSQVIPAADTVLDVEITPNRGDLVSMLGMARETRAQFGGEICMPETQPNEGEQLASDDVRVLVDDSDGCFRYVARVVRGVQLSASPAWLVEKLEAAGLRAINVVVDVTNLVLLEFGQPLHAFDLATLKGAEIRVRAARSGESIVTLDGERRALDAEDLVIADAEDPVAIAGVMGGAATEVRDETTDILIESAHFDPVRVRRTARRLGLQTEASYRFERGVDPEGIRRAADRAALLLAELAGGTVSAGIVEARGRDFPRTDEVSLEPEHPNRLLGTALSREEVVALLARVDIVAESQSDGTLRCQVPSHRNDVSIPADLIEEVARVYGYDRIPTTMPTASLAPVELPRSHRLAEQVRDAMRGAGLLEMRSFPMIRPEDLDAIRLPEDDGRRGVVGLLNPIVEEASILRSTLVPSLLRAAQRNLARQVDRVRLFEVAPVFLKRGDGELPSEPLQVAAILAGVERGSVWDAAEPSPLFFEAKGVVEYLLADLGHSPAFELAEVPEPYLHPGACVAVALAKHRLGMIGELHPETMRAFEIEVPTAVVSLDLSSLLGLEEPATTYREVSRQPAARRDLAVVLSKAQPAGEVLEAIRRTGGNTLVSAGLFDRYEGKGIPEGKVSLAFRMVFQRHDRALTDAEVAKMTDRVSSMLAHRFGGELR